MSGYDLFLKIWYGFLNLFPSPIRQIVIVVLLPIVLPLVMLADWSWRFAGFLMGLDNSPKWVRDSY